MLTAGIARSVGSRRARAIIAGAILLAIAASLRIIALDSDPPGWLSWSAGIYTDEGMYAADARSEALFGHWTRGEFHGAMLSPALYAVQLAAFRRFGAQIVTARAISAASGLLTIALLWIALRFASGERAAWIGATLLAIATPFALYNRLALMESPLACLLTGAAAAIAAGAEGGAAAAGALFIAAVAVKPLAWLALPAFAVGAGAYGRKRAALFLGAAALSFLAFWWVAQAPYAHTLARMDQYYVSRQYLPHTWAGLLGNVERGLITGKRDGLAPTLALLWPIGTAAALFGLVDAVKRRRPFDLLAALWLLLPAAAWIASSYTPSRYYVMVMPAMAALAAMRLARAGRPAIAAVMTAAVIVDGAALAPALLRPAAERAAASAAMEKVLEPGSIIAGQFAPELAFGTNLESIYVQPDLANDDPLVARQKIDYVLVTDSTFWNRWWDAAYPGLRGDENRVGHVTAGGAYDVVIYQAPATAKWLADDRCSDRFSGLLRD